MDLPDPALAEQFFEARLETTYAHDARLDVWVPRTMTEEYGVWRDDKLRLQRRASPAASTPCRTRSWGHSVLGAVFCPGDVDVA